MQIGKFGRITAWIALVATVFVLFFSTIYISEHEHHDCTGEDCPICAVLDECIVVLRSLSTAVIAVSLGVTVFVSIQKSECYENSIPVCISLISQKVRLND